MGFLDKMRPGHRSQEVLNDETNEGVVQTDVEALPTDAEEHPEDVMEEHPEDVTEERLEEAVEEITEEVAEKVAEEIDEEITAEVAEESISPEETEASLEVNEGEVVEPDIKDDDTEAISSSDNDTAPIQEKTQFTPRQLRAAEKASQKALRRREKELRAAEKKNAKEKAEIKAQAALQKKKAKQHRRAEEEEALKLITTLAADVEHFDPESIGMSQELYHRALELKRRKHEEEKKRRIAEYKKQKAKEASSSFSKAVYEKANKARFLNCLNLTYRLKLECEKDYKISSFVIHLLIAFIIITFAGHFIFELQFLPILICCFVYFFSAPSLIYYHERKKYESNRFRDCSRYIEQMIFSFTRRHKLLTALEETRLVLDGSIGEAIDYAIDIIRNRVGEEDIYAVALRKIEEFFPSSRVRNLHEFLIAVERDGGRHETTMKILLDDVREWDIRTNQFKQNQAVKGTSLLVSILMSVGVCWFMTNILPDELGGDISGNVIYQLATTIMLIVMFLMYLFGNRKLTRSWITDGRNAEKDKIEADRKAILAYYANPQGKIKPMLAIIRMQTEVEKVFPRWILRFALLSSSYPITVALAKSVSTAPFVIKEDLEKMVEAINRKPTSIEPYLEFVQYYDLPQVRSMMMMIYSLSEYGLNDADQQILSLVKRNNALQATAEQIENDEQLARFSLYTIIPMIFASIVMMVDVVLIVLNMVANIL